MTRAPGFFVWPSFNGFFNCLQKKGWLVLIAAEHAAMADVFEAVLIDHDRNEIRVDIERGNKGVRKLFDNFAFLFRGPAFAHLENYYGHSFTFTIGSIGQAGI
jgi:hypothetical protein